MARGPYVARLVFSFHSIHFCDLYTDLSLLQELQTQLGHRADQYHRLLDQGESMLLARGGDEAGPGTTQTQQNLALLQNKWASLNTKMDDRRVRTKTLLF